MKKINIRLFIEPMIWIGFIVFPLILFPTLQPFVDKGLINPPLKGIIILHSLLIGFYYFNYHIALPRFYFTKKYTLYFPIIATILLLLLAVMFADPSFNPLPSPPFVYAKTAFAISIILRFMLMLLLSIGIAGYSRLKQAEKEKLNAELQSLKTQINPHFLFNTLNSIYALAVAKSDSTPESITRLASIMRYAITDTALEKVELEKELAYVSAYIELEKLRLTKKVELNYTINGNVVGKQIAPMLFIPIIENAFKHGVSTNEESRISIKFDISDKTLNLNVKNNKISISPQHTNGLGLKNVQKRLQLLYAAHHQLKIEENEKEFTVNLSLQFND